MLDLQEYALITAITSVYNNILSFYDWHAQLHDFVAFRKVAECAAFAHCCSHWNGLAQAAG